MIAEFVAISVLFFGKSLVLTLNQCKKDDILQLCTQPVTASVHVQMRSPTGGFLSLVDWPLLPFYAVSIQFQFHIQATTSWLTPRLCVACMQWWDLSGWLSVEYIGAAFLAFISGLVCIAWVVSELFSGQEEWSFGVWWRMQCFWLSSWLSTTQDR